MVGLQEDAESFFYFVLIFFLFLNATTFEGVLLSIALPNASVTQVVIGILTGVWNIFSGFLLPRGQIPDYLLLFYYINPDSYSLNALVTSNIGVCDDDSIFNDTELILGADSDQIACNLIVVENDDGTNITLTVAEYLEYFYNFQPERRFIDAGVLVGWISAVMIGIVLSTVYVQYIKR